MQFVVRFNRPAVATGPDAVVITAERYVESYHEGRLASFRFFDGDGEEVAMVRAEDVVYVALAGRAAEPAEGPLSPVPFPPSSGERGDPLR